MRRTKERNDSLTARFTVRMTSHNSQNKGNHGEDGRNEEDAGDRVERWSG